MSAKRHLQRYVYAAIGALVHFLLIRILGESMSSGLMNAAEAFVKSRKNRPDEINS
jgi:hypothetical protein